ncbi:MAG: hypothetical protein ABII89_07805 [Candidatus Omnitrophota bacterium]
MLKKIYIAVGSIVFLLLVFKAVKAAGNNMVIYVTKPISGVKKLSTDTLVMGKISREIKITAAPGEYEPASFIVFARSDINSLTLKASDLTGESGIIPSGNIDIKVVKCWYQGGGAWSGSGDVQDQNKRVLVPELLLNDDTLVKVDYKKEKNYLKVVYSRGTASEKEKYIWMSEPNEVNPHPGRDARIRNIEDIPVQDSPVLLPVDIPARTNKQFWITVKAPDTAKAGVYTGTIILSSGGENSALTLTVRVLPFKLASPRRYDLQEDFVSSIYYHGKLNPDRPEGSISSEDKSKEQLRAELKNMFSHGVTNPQCNQGFSEALFRTYLDIRQEAGMGGQPLYLLNWCPDSVHASSNPADIKKTIEITQSYGIPEVYFYGADEARGDALTAQRPAWEATRKAGGKIFVAGYVDSNFEKMGDIQDLLVCWGAPLSEEAAKWHSVGHKIWCYFNPQSGAENPEIYRRNFGLLLWLKNYDGAATFSYQAAADNVWNDFDNAVQRDFVFAYPTVNGVIDTLAWEGYREAIDDIRYATTLKLEIAEAKKSADAGIKETALSAEQWLSQLDINRDLDTVRLEIINHILKLKNRSPITE